MSGTVFMSSASPSNSFRIPSGGAASYFSSDSPPRLVTPFNSDRLKISRPRSEWSRTSSSTGAGASARCVHRSCDARCQDAARRRADDQVEEFMDALSRPAFEFLQDPGRNQAPDATAIKAQDGCVARFIRHFFVRHLESWHQ